MLPTLNPISQPIQTTKEGSPVKQEGEDELLEVGAMLAVLKLLFA
jgi:hypothetical protein